MLTRCPECKTTFRVTAEQLAMAGGRVRCGRCSAIFDARRSMIEQPPEPPAVVAESSESDTKPSASYITDYTEFFATPSARSEAPVAAQPESSQCADHDSDASAHRSETPLPSAPADELSARETGPEAPAEDATPEVSGDEPDHRAGEETEPRPVPAAPHEPAPDLLADDLQALRRKRSAAGILGWATLIVALALLLGAQVTYVMRDNLARFPIVRPWLTRMCDAIGCAPPLHRDLTKLRLLSSSVNPQARHPDVLSVRTTMVNTADYPQPYPILQLQLSDLQGRPIGMRRFQPAEYLPPGTDLRAGMPAQTPITVHLEVVSPGARVTGYQFDFR